jgi:hypothetical protein
VGEGGPGELLGLIYESEVIRYGRTFGKLLN